MMIMMVVIFLMEDIVLMLSRMDLMDVYDYFSENWNKATSNTNIDEYVMHHVHQTNSQIYDYKGKENSLPHT